MADRKSASFSPRIQEADFLNQSHTRIIGLLVSLRFRSSLQSVPRRIANFGIGTLGTVADRVPNIDHLLGAIVSQPERAGSDKRFHGFLCRRGRSCADGSWYGMKASEPLNVSPTRSLAAKPMAFTRNGLRHATPPAVTHDHPREGPSGVQGCDLAVRRLRWSFRAGSRPVVARRAKTATAT